MDTIQGGQRVLQTGTSTTTIYTFKWYSVASSTGSGARYATTTEYVFNGETLLSTVDQQFASGLATGTAQTRYVDPDHLGSTNVITNASGTVISTKDYYPFGGARINSGTASLARGYIGEFSDDAGLSYLNARYYNPAQGQFLSQDPTFIALGNQRQLQQLSRQSQQQLLADPQQMNSYSYARNNPITNKDTDGNHFNPAMLAPVFGVEIGLGPIGWIAAGVTGIIAGNYLYHSLDEPNWQTMQLVDGNGYNTDPTGLIVLIVKISPPHLPCARREDRMRAAFRPSSRSGPRGAA